MTPLKASLYKTARIVDDPHASIPQGFSRGQFVAVRYLGIGLNDEPTFAISAEGVDPALVEASILERFCL